MGLLSNTATQSALLNILVKRGALLSVLCYLGGFVWFIALSHPDFNGRVYFSENALLPGLVRSEYSGYGLETLHGSYKAQLKAIKSDSEVPLEWLEKELTSLGLEVYAQDYQFTYPMNLMNNQTARGKNIYAFVRAPRSSSTEAMVMSVPLRPTGSGLTGTTGSVALMLSMAKEMMKHTYWSKDIIFLFTQHEFVGIQAWLDGYLGVSTSSYITADPLEARGGVIQAAVNLEFNELSFSSISVLTEGINGILPNLDLVNLVHRLTKDQSINVKIHGREDFSGRDDLALVKHNTQTTFLMMCHQATGMASGNHGLFLRYRIDSVTIKGLTGNKHQLRSAGVVVEGTFRSINNLLEKFHQSFFFYLLPSTSRYISIGVYMIPFAIITAAALIQALALWGKFTSDVANRNSKLKANKETAFTTDGKLTEETLSTLRLPDTVMQGIYHLIPIVIGCQLAGFMLSCCPEFFGTGDIRQIPPTQAVMLGGLACMISTMMIARSIMVKEEFEEMNWRLLKFIALTYYSLILFSLSLLNISLAFILAITTLPVYCLARPLRSRILTVLQAALLMVVSPVGVFLITLVTYNHVSGVMKFRYLTAEYMITNSHDSLLYGIIDYMVFKNYLYDIVSLVLYPIWLMLWSVIWMNV